MAGLQEKGIGDKLIAASVMLVGVLILYLPVSLTQGITLGVGALVAMVIAFYSTRHAADSLKPDRESRPGRKEIVKKLDLWHGSSEVVAKLGR